MEPEIVGNTGCVPIDQASNTSLSYSILVYPSWCRYPSSRNATSRCCQSHMQPPPSKIPGIWFTSAPQDFGSAPRKHSVINHHDYVHNGNAAQCISFARILQVANDLLSIIFSVEFWQDLHILYLCSELHILGFSKGPRCVGG